MENPLSSLKVLKNLQHLRLNGRNGSKSPILWDMKEQVCGTNYPHNYFIPKKRKAKFIMVFVAGRVGWAEMMNKTRDSAGKDNSMKIVHSRDKRIFAQVSGPKG